MTFSMTPYGVQAYVPVMEFGDGHILVNMFCSIISSMTPAPGQLYLLLRRDASDKSGRHPRYHCQCFSDSTSIVGDHDHCRLVALPEDQAPSLDLTKWMDIYISPHPPYRFQLTSNVRELISRLSLGISPPFRMKPSTFSTLSRYHDLHLLSVTSMPVPWIGSPPVELVFRRGLPTLGHPVVVTLGRCTNAAGQAQTTSDEIRVPAAPGPHYVMVEFGPDDLDWPLTRASPASHACPGDHVTDGCVRAFIDEPHNYALSISFNPGTLESAGETLEIHFEVSVSR